jgi:cytochrome c-type biogenesis protein CcmF
MIVEFGHFALILAACVALIQGVLPLAGTVNDHQRWQALAKPAAVLQFLLLAFSFAALAQAALTDDFSVKYIAEHSNSLLPAQYKLASVWGGHEGSLLLWVLMLSGWTVAVALFSRSLPLAMVARVIGILGLVSTGFLMFILTTSSPLSACFLRQRMAVI